MSGWQLFGLVSVVWLAVMAVLVWAGTRAAHVRDAQRGPHLYQPGPGLPPSDEVAEEAERRRRQRNTGGTNPSEWRSAW